MDRSSFDAGTLVVIAAHADDAELNAGGTMAKWAARGGRVHIILVTSNCSGTILPPGDDTGERAYRLPAAATSELRDAEQDAAAALIGASVTRLGYPQRHYFDGSRVVRIGYGDLAAPPPDSSRLPPLLLAFQEPEHVARMASLLVELAPRLILCQPPSDLDPEHHAVAALVWAAVHERGAKDALASAPLRFYTPGSSCPSGLFAIPYDTFEDITPHFEQKIAMCAAHASQMSAARWKMVRERASAYGAQCGALYAEPFVTARREP